jgi:lysyl oxidase
MRLKLIAVAAAIAAVTAACVTGPPAGTPLPDLAMPQILQLTVSNPTNGTHALKFSTTVVNIGRADFRISASRASTSSAWKVSQVLPDGRGNLDTYETTAGYVYGGDGHNHWHLKNLASYKLYALPNMTLVARSLKAGFCFFDTTPYNFDLVGAPTAAIYNSLNCGAQSALTSGMGLSIGWGDTYPKGLPGQEIDITGVPAGKYRLQVTADEAKAYWETTRANNSNWTDFTLSYTTAGKASISVTGQGPQP